MKEKRRLNELEQLQRRYIWCGEEKMVKDGKKV